MKDGRSVYFDSLANDWNAMVAFDDRAMSLLSKIEVRRGDRVLDLGSGTGRISAQLRRAVGRRGRVFAVDFAFKMLVEAKKIREPHLSHYVCADAHELACKTDSFDAVVCYSAFPHFREQRAALSEMRRVLKPSGKVYILHLEGSSSLNEFHRGLGGEVGADILPARDEMRSLLQQCQFEGVEVIDRPDVYWASARK